LTVPTPTPAVKPKSKSVPEKEPIGIADL